MNIRSSCLKKRLKSVFPIKQRIWRYPLKQKEPQITVITVFDGDSKAKDVFADVIIQKFLRDREQKALPRPKTILYNADSVPQNQGLSGLCGESP